MPQGEHSAILSTFIKLPFDIKIFDWSIFEWPLMTGFTVVYDIPQSTILTGIFAKVTRKYEFWCVTETTQITFLNIIVGV